MTGTLETYKAIAEREKASREEAERLLEVNNLAIYKKSAELERSAKELRAANMLLSEIMTVAPSGILLCSDDFIIQDGNAASAREFGCVPTSLAGHHLDDFFPYLSETLSELPDDEFTIDINEAKRLSEEKFYVEMRGFIGPISANIRYLLLFHDITERLQAEEKRKIYEQRLSEAHRLEAIGELSAGIAHEINTPIQFIGDNLAYLDQACKKIHAVYIQFEALRAAATRDGVYGAQLATIDQLDATMDLASLDREIAAAVRESRDGIRQVRDIVLLMKEFAHPGGADKVDANLNDIALNAAKLCRHRREAVDEIKFDLDENLPTVKCQRGQVQQVVLNLILNALDAVEEKETVEGRIQITTSFDDEGVNLAISDNGCGVPLSLREKIFNPFFTTKPVGKGTGQGLALAKDCIVKGHGGDLRQINVDSFATTFLISLPFKSEPAPLDQEYGDAYRY